MAMPPAALLLAGLAALTLWSPHLSAATAAAAAPPTVIHLVADDLGYHDTNWKNHQVSTDALDALVKAGVEIPDFYVRLRAPYAPLPPTDPARLRRAGVQDVRALPRLRDDGSIPVARGLL